MKGKGGGTSEPPPPVTGADERGRPFNRFLHVRVPTGAGSPCSCFTPQILTPPPLQCVRPCSPSSPPRTVARHSIHGGKAGGVILADAGTKGRLERCDIADNKKAGVAIYSGADPLLTACKCDPLLALSCSPFAFRVG